MTGSSHSMSIKLCINVSNLQLIVNGIQFNSHSSRVANNQFTQAPHKEHRIPRISHKRNVSFTAISKPASH